MSLTKRAMFPEEYKKFDALVAEINSQSHCSECNSILTKKEVAMGKGVCNACIWAMRDGDDRDDEDDDEYDDEGGYY